VAVSVAARSTIAAVAALISTPDATHVRPPDTTASPTVCAPADAMIDDWTAYWTLLAPRCPSRRPTCVEPAGL